MHTLPPRTVTSPNRRLLCSAFSPVSTFLGQEDYDSVVEKMHLADGTMFGLPIVFDTADDSIVPGDKLLLTYNGQNIGTLEVTEKWAPNKPLECLKCYGTTSIEHPAVQMVSMERGKYYLAGKARSLLLACIVPTVRMPAGWVSADAWLIFSTQRVSSARVDGCGGACRCKGWRSPSAYSSARRPRRCARRCRRA